MRFPLWLVILSAVAFAGGPKPIRFNVLRLSVDGGVRQVDAVDLDGDGQRDLVAVVIKGEEENAERSLAVFWNRDAGFSPTPDLVFPAPADVCAFDLARGELIEVLPNGVRARSFAGRTAGAPRMVVTEPTLFLQAPRAELPRLHLLQSLDAKRPDAMLLPGQGKLLVYTRDGERFVRAGALSVEVKGEIGLPHREGSERDGLPSFTVSSRFPQLRVVDLDGDGRRDIALVEGQRVRGFLQGPTGFSAEPSFEHTFEVRTTQEKADGASVELILVDLDADGRADAIVTKNVSKGISSAKTTVSVFYATANGFPAKADQLIESDGAAITSVQLADITGDGKLDLLVPSMQFGIFSIIRMLTSSSVKVGFELYPMGAKKRFEAQPTASRNLVFKLSLNENSSDLQAVDMTGDFDGDGHPDLAFGVDKDELALFSGGKPGEIFASDPMATVPVRAYGHALPISLDGGRRTDLVLWYPSTRGHEHEISVVIGRP